jgi:hypothetical protein
MHYYKKNVQLLPCFGNRAYLCALKSENIYLNGKFLY